MDTANKLFDFIEKCPTSYHTADTVASRLSEQGFTELDGEAAWELKDGGKYYTVRHGSLIAFVYRTPVRAFSIVSAHTDTPALKLKAVPDVKGKYAKIGVECYGGAIHYTWFDRPLSIAGRVAVRTDTGAEIRLVTVPHLKVVIPSVAPHLNRTVNSGFAPNPAVDLLPIYSLSGDGSVLDKVAEALDIEAGDILSHDLYLHDGERGVTFGKDNELLLSSRIDDLASVYTALEAFLAADATADIPLLALFDNEEVGSSTAEGAASDFLQDTVLRICADRNIYRSAVAASLMLSSDGAHALHPNHPELSDPECHPILGGGVAVKYNANRRYATDAISDALLREVAGKNGLTLQKYSNRADLPGGSTLGSIATTRIPVLTVDIGIPQLAMHSLKECCAVSDIDAMTALVRAFYSSERKLVK
ncbi:MAG: M18 family aminopeptidase [Clostridia bacterium]|nr:M18 family aminopeptidase [Clostridia bacterium]